MKKWSQAPRKRSHTDFSWPRVTGPIVFHSACSALIASAVRTQSVESASASARTHERFLLLQVLLALGGLLREEVLALLVDLILRGLEAGPQRFGLRARRGGDGLPPLLQRAHLGRGLLRLGLGDRDERFHLRAELFLHLDVGPALPLFGVAQLLDARRHRGAHRLQTHGQIVAILLGRQRPHRADRQLGVLQDPLGVLEREILGGGARLEILHGGLQALQVLLLRPRRGLRDARSRAPRVPATACS